MLAKAKLSLGGSNSRPPRIHARPLEPGGFRVAGVKADEPPPQGVSTWSPYAETAKCETVSLLGNGHRVRFALPRSGEAKHDTVSLFENGNGFRFAEPHSIHAHQAIDQEHRQAWRSTEVDF